MVPGLIKFIVQKHGSQPTASTTSKVQKHESHHAMDDEKWWG